MLAGIICQGSLLRTSVELGGEVDDLPATIAPGHFRDAMAQMSIAGLVLRDSRLRQSVVGTPVLRMTPRMSHPYYHGAIIAQIRHKKRAQP